MSKRKIVWVALLVCGALIVLAICIRKSRPWTPAIHRSRKEVAELLKGAGYEQDDRGRISKPSPGGGLILAYDPELKNPSTGFKAFLGRINTCYVATSKADECVIGAPRCVTVTPWQDDPAGEDCAPELCVREYQNLRKTLSEPIALTRMVRGVCYPGLAAVLHRAKP